MKKTMLIAAMVISFMVALNAYGAEPDRAAGQCSYHGGMDKDTGMCKDGTSPGTYAPKPGSANAGESADGAAEAKAAAAAEKARIAKEKADAKAAAAAQAKAAKEKAKVCKTATSKHNSLINSSSWKQIQAGMLGDSADDCSDSWDEKYAPKIAACKTDSCRNGYQTTLNKKYSACEVRELWALDWETKVTTAEDAKNSACN